ncbi:glycosyltransferase family 39 protein [Pseudomonas sp. FEN]|uniref:glycosyltransferase family 39 protein n=1 Tax=Pseudomonas sp. FEN TaxID=2767468 RepID=UPI00174E7F70|nr:glycosyltransferase family 39 protein [Pseudomonas sp. FEN]
MNTLNKGKRPRKVYCLLLMIIGLGVYFRFYDTLYQSLWMDELFSAGFSDPDNSLSEVFRVTVEDVHPPLYQMILWCAYKIFGYHEMIGRYLSLCFGIVLIPAMFMLGRRLFDDKTGLLVAFLSAVNIFLILSSQEVRSYSLLIVLTVLSFVTFLDLLRQQTIRSMMIYMVVGALLVNTHYFGFFPIMVQAVLLGYESFREGFKKRLFYRALVSGGGMLVSLLPIVPYIIINAGKKAVWIHRPVNDFVEIAFLKHFGNATLGVLFVGLLIIGLSQMLQHDKHRDALRLLVLWWTGTLAISYIRSTFQTPILSYRNTIVLLPVTLLVVAYAIRSVRDRFTRYTIVVFILSMSMAHLWGERNLPSFERAALDWRSATQKVIGDNKNIPVYGYGSDLYTTYFKLLGSSIKVEPTEVVEEKMKRQTAPEHFYILDLSENYAMKNNYPGQYAVVLIAHTVYDGTAVLEFRSLQR